MSTSTSDQPTCRKRKFEEEIQAKLQQLEMSKIDDEIATLKDTISAREKKMRMIEATARQAETETAELVQMSKHRILENRKKLENHLYEIQRHSQARIIKGSLTLWEQATDPEMKEVLKSAILDEIKRLVSTFYGREAESMHVASSSLDKPEIYSAILTSIM